MREGMVGHLRIGAIPVTLPIVSLLTTPFFQRHEQTEIIVTSSTSIEIQRHLDDFSLDIGITYLDNEPLARIRSWPLYQERYVLLTRADGAFRGRTTIGWSEAADLPMCLLTPDMQKSPDSGYAFSGERRRNPCVGTDQFDSSRCGLTFASEIGRPSYPTRSFCCSGRWTGWPQFR